MDRAAFLARQSELAEKLRRAVPRSARTKALTAELRDLVIEQLAAEVGTVPPPAATPAPPPDFRDRVGDLEASQRFEKIELGPRRAFDEPYGGHAPYWVDL